MDKQSPKGVFLCVQVVSSEIILCLGKRKLGISVDDVKVYLEDGTEIDEDETMLACENGFVFLFWPAGEKWQMQSSCTSSTGEHSGVKGDVMANSKGDLII